MFIRRNFKARHRILKVLFEHDLNYNPSDGLDKKKIHFNEISNQLPKYDRSFLLDNLDYLRTTEEIYCSMQFDNSNFFILSSGSHSYRDKKYIREGIKDQINYIYDIVKTVSVIVLLAIAIWTFAQNLYQTKQNQKNIDQLQKDVQDLRLKNSK